MGKKVRLVAFSEAGGLRPALYSEDRTAAAYIRYLLRIEGEPGIARCPLCQSWFVQKRPDQIYDLPAHRERHRVIRWRAGKQGKKKSLVDTPLTLSRNDFCGRVPFRITVPIAPSYSHNRTPCGR